jgi:hypothetical protein
MRHLLPQPVRLRLLAAYGVLLLLLSWFATGNWLPAWNHEGLWFYSGAFAFLTGALIEAPTHVVPKQSLVFSLVALLAAVGFGLSTFQLLSPAAVSVWIGILFLELLILFTSVTAIQWKDASAEEIRGRIARTGHAISQFLGRPAIVTSGPFLFGLVAYHFDRPQEAVALTLGWTLLVFARPLEHSLDLLNAIRTPWQAEPPAAYLGDIVGHAVPGIVTIRHRGTAHVLPGTPLLVRGDDGSPNVALALSYVGIAEGLWLRALQLGLSPQERNLLRGQHLEDGSCSILRDRFLLRSLETEATGAMRRRDKLVGLVAKATDTRLLRFELLRYDLEIKEGQLVEARIGAKAVLYQVLNGLTQEDILQQKNTRGYVLGEARKIGSWSTERTRFEHVHWVPAPNTPVFITETRPTTNPTAVGVFPETDYPVFVDPHDLVTHNTAVLGILGVGKTFLTLELVERMLQAGIRVICLDLTNQYAQELQPYHDREAQDRVIAMLQETGRDGKDKVSRNVEEGGSVAEFEIAVQQLARRFLDPNRPNRLCILNPNGFEVWRQDSKPFDNRASMATLTAAEITRIVSEAALKACQELGMSTEARCCLVYEEAHSLIPEWNAVASEGDKTASNGTARAILQGRKFGLGCVVVTQRTASVTKTILNQCNTVFAMRTFDSTGMEFLSNYIGSDYTAVLSTLADRHGVVFGKASSCADPVLVRFNDRDQFVQYARPPLVAVPVAQESNDPIEA